MKYKQIFTLVSFMILTIISKSQIITTVVGGGSNLADGCLAKNAALNGPSDVKFDKFGNMYITGEGNHVIRKVNLKDTITTIAGTGLFGYIGDGGPATSARLQEPQSTTFDSIGNMYIADYANYVVRKIDLNGIITTIAGNGKYGYSGDGDSAINARLEGVVSLAFNSKGELYIADNYNNRIRMVDKKGIITTVAGTGAVGDGAGGYSGDGGLAVNARLSNPSGIIFDSKDNLYIADSYNNRIRKIDTNGIISTIAGSGPIGFGNGDFSGDGGLAVVAKLYSPIGIALDKNGNIFFSDGSNRIRKIDETGIITTIAGSGKLGFNGGHSGDGGLATSATLNHPEGIAFDSDGNLFIADWHNNVIRKVSFSTLPLTISSATAIRENKDIAINWQTATELNTSHFIIQHSINGTSFTEIGTIKAVGSGANSYKFTDNNPAVGINYYRLQGIDKDGSSSYSKVVSVNFVSTLSLTITPNPAKDFATISFSKAVDKATIAVYDMAGKAVITQSLSGTSSYKLNTQALTNGVYVIKVKTAAGSYNEKLLINK
ncbi:T9SS type A sorting domain-containing protein [Parasediminibacterium sp. JCM 36343]|uniref:NHL repeat-containing protein n=1 Tax=Parasediminibacterium sp. JCM 36343 TaxID=3374279 RepID=UPI00397881F9